MAKRNHFSMIYLEHKTNFTVHGVADADGHPTRLQVYPGESIDDIWPCIEGDYEAGNGGLGDRIWDAAAEHLNESLREEVAA